MLLLHHFTTFLMDR